MIPSILRAATFWRAIATSAPPRLVEAYTITTVRFIAPRSGFPVKPYTQNPILLFLETLPKTMSMNHTNEYHPAYNCFEISNFTFFF